MSDSSVSYKPQVVQIYFDTATFNEIEKDRKVTVEAQLGLIGGTMGLFTGFSLVSGVEIIYFVVRFFFMSLKQNKKEGKDNNKFFGSGQLHSGMGDMLKEFLESSTIHGLSHISTAKVGILLLVSY